VRVLHGAGFRFDVASYMTWAKRTVERAGGSVLCSRVVDSLVQEDNIVVGARVCDRDGAVTVLARHTVLATGGFQGNSALMSDYFGSRSRQLLRRGNPYSAGDGLRLGLSVGGTASEGMDTFYGHLVPWPLPQYVESDFMRLVLFFSEHGFLFNLDGDRFTDETRGDHRNAQAVLAQPQARALLVFDAHVRDRHARTPLVSGSQTFDWVSESESAGAHVANSSTIEAIAEAASRWGYNGHSLARNLQQLRQSPTSKDCYHPLESSPFVAIEAKPAITFTEGGLRIDTKARVLSVSGSPVGGLYAAGADSGGVYNGGYAGGLAFAGAFGMLAAEEIVRSSRH
jgi:succinate dehydrogenase/fumarate reductase flavoprotein subunit